jgi:hypothetical protein
MGKTGVPSWIDAAGETRDRRAADEWSAAGAVGGSSRAQAATSRLLAWVLWGGIGLALVLGLVNCAGLPGAAGDNAESPPPTQLSPEPVPPAGGCAELVVSAWLAGDTDLLADLPGMQRSAVEPGMRQASRTYIAGVTGDERAWAYLVGADVLARDGDGDWRAAGTQFFTVTMVPAPEGGCQGWRPAALPAQVAAPVLSGEDTTAIYEVNLPIESTPLADTLQAFFSGLLTGTEDIERYVAPGVVIAAPDPPPYEEVAVAELRATLDPTERGTVNPPDGTVVQLLATVTVAEDQLPLVYPVTVGVRGGRWEVVAIDPLVRVDGGLTDD